MTSASEWNAREYAQIASLQAEMAAEVLALLEFDGLERVLDVGCGDGKITAQIASRVPHGTVIGVDASHKMVAYASTHFGSDVWPNLRFQVGDVRSLGFSNEFDLIVSLNALHWVPDQDAALHSIATALKPDGLAQLRLVPKGERTSLEEVIERTRCSPRWSSYFREFSDPYLHSTPEEYVAIAERNGLQVLHLKTASRAWDFKSRAAFAASCSVTLVAWTQRLPEDERMVFINDVLDRYRATTAGSEGSGENTFLFYQMDITAKRRRTSKP